MRSILLPRGGISRMQRKKEKSNRGHVTALFLSFFSSWGDEGMYGKAQAKGSCRKKDLDSVRQCVSSQLPSEDHLRTIHLERLPHSYLVTKGSGQSKDNLSMRIA